MMMMCSPEALRGLRGKNRELLTQLKDHGKILRSLSGTWSHNASTNRVINESVRTLSKSQVVDTETNELDPITAAVPNNSERHAREDWKMSQGVSPAEQVLTLVQGHQGQGLARAALSRSQTHDPHETSAFRPLTLSIRGDQDKSQDAVECCLPKPSVPDRDIGQHSFPGHGDLLMDEGSSRSSQARKSEVRSNPSPQTHQSEKGDGHMGTLECRALEPLLGYDWIAGLLDVENSATEYSEQFFLDLQNFRRINRQECVNSRHTGAKENEDSSLSRSRERNPQHAMETHKCIFCYRINSRLFPTPLDFKAACPVCRMPKTQHPHTTAEPAFTRISIPRSAVVPAYQYRAHRRSSFDPSTSLGLPSHCLAGRCNTAPANKDQLSSLDLHSSLDKVPSDRCGA
ncbi:migration and invasion inhibitory protein isoform X2 [Scleropages formosus]|uniref:migration and invasion inhibitory protein isoform X2 n=1 Tax=Scleropages formosus TaxID=113540 RepID=UPI0010FA9675|nr:migration and invasion-inhibitory protein isoform X2 [Scleropages formosus]